jgi:two-component system, NtrC family, response regulator AtoC
LRALQERKFTPVGSNREVSTNARVIAATNRNLEKMIEDGGFREDLFYRLNVMPIFLPPLRERIDDLDFLAQHFVRQFNAKMGRSLSGFTPEAMKALRAHRWPGNIRELENLVERSFILETQNIIGTSSLPENVLEAARSNTDSSRATGGNTLDFEQFKEQSEKEFIVRALKMNQGRINQTVAFAGIPKNTLLRKIKKYGINVREL